MCGKWAKCFEERVDTKGNINTMNYVGSLNKEQSLFIHEYYFIQVNICLFNAILVIQ